MGSSNRFPERSGPRSQGQTRLWRGRFACPLPVDAGVSRPAQQADVGQHLRRELPALLDPAQSGCRLEHLQVCPAIDQTELGEIAALDPSTAGDVTAPLERRGLVRRSGQGPRGVCDLTTQGALVLDQVSPHVANAQRLLVDADGARAGATFAPAVKNERGEQAPLYPPRSPAAAASWRCRARRAATSASVKPQADG